MSVSSYYLVARVILESIIDSAVSARNKILNEQSSRMDLTSSALFTITFTLRWAIVTLNFLKFLTPLASPRYPPL